MANDSVLHHTELPGVLLSTPTVHTDARGGFHEWFKASEFEQATGYPFMLQQANMSTSAPGVVRGLHYADVPPGQAKFVTCAAGRIVDVVADIRRGSPTFGQHIAVELSPENAKGLYIPGGFAHGFIALEQSTVVYLTTSEYDPEVEHEVSAFDGTLNIDWDAYAGGIEKILSDKDRKAPALGDADLPDYELCQEMETEMKDGWVLANQEASAD